MHECWANDDSLVISPEEGTVRFECQLAVCDRLSARLVILPYRHSVKVAKLA